MDAYTARTARTAESSTKDFDTQVPSLVLQSEDAGRKSHSGQSATSAAGSGSVSPTQLEPHAQPPENSAGKSDESKPPISKGTSLMWLKSSKSKKGLPSSSQRTTFAAGSGSVSPKHLDVQPSDYSAGDGNESKPPVSMGTSLKWLRQSISKKDNVTGQESASVTNEGEDTEKVGEEKLVKKQHPEQATEDRGGKKR